MLGLFLRLSKASQETQKMHLFVNIQTFIPSPSPQTSATACVRNQLCYPQEGKTSPVDASTATAITNQHYLDEDRLFKDRYTPMQIIERDKIKLEVGFYRISKLTTRIPVLLFQLYCQGIL